MTVIACPNCGANSWRAVEHHSSSTPVEFHWDGVAVEIEMSPMAEMVRVMSTSAVEAYYCEGCGYSFAAAALASALGGLKEASVEEKQDIVERAQPEEPPPHDEKAAAARHDAKLSHVKPETPALDKFKRVFGESG